MRQSVQLAQHLHSACCGVPPVPWSSNNTARHQLSLLEQYVVDSSRLLHADFPHTRDVLCDIMGTNRSKLLSIAACILCPVVNIRIILIHAIIEGVISERKHLKQYIPYNIHRVVMCFAMVVLHYQSLMGS